MENLVGREQEIALLKEALASPEAELIAVYRRRRVDKTYSIRMVYEESIVFGLTGANRSSTEEQLRNFALAAQKYFFKEAGYFLGAAPKLGGGFCSFVGLAQAVTCDGEKGRFLSRISLLF